MEHTPGPWEVKELAGQLYVASVPEFYCVAEMNFTPVPIRREANAHLIAAAPTAPHECDDPNCPGNINRKKLEAFPELLEALQKLVSSYNIEDHQGTMTKMDWFFCLDECWQKALNAITEATV